MRMIGHIFSVLLLAAPAYAGDATAPNASCSEHAANVQQARDSGIYKCTSNVWVQEPLYIGASSATCDSTTASLLRYNSGTLEYCNGSAWTALNTSASSTLSIKYTSTTYTGNLGGVAGGDTKCSSEYSGYHMCNWTTDIIANSATGTLPNISSYTANNQSAPPKNVGWADGYAGYTCSTWTNGTSSYYGGIGYTNYVQGWMQSTLRCDISYPVMCCL
jgi:hypothetical protein